MLRKVMVATCAIAACWMAMPEESDAQVRIRSNRNGVRIRMNTPRRAVMPVPMMAPAYGYYGNPGFYGHHGYYSNQPVYVVPNRSRMVVTPNRVRISGPRGTIRIRR